MRSGAKVVAALSLVSLQLLAVHGALAELAARLGLVSALLSPGSHSQLTALVLGTTFLVVRVASLVLLPPVVAGCLGFLGSSWLLRGAAGARASPSGEASPMLSRPRAEREGRGSR